MSSWNTEPCAIYPQLCITARPPYACPLKYHSQSFFFSPTLTQAWENMHVHACASRPVHTYTHKKKKRKKRRVQSHSHTHTTNLTQTPITLHLVCDLIQCIDNLPVSGTQPTDHFQGTLLSAAPPPRWLGTQTSIRSTRRKEENKGRRDVDRAPDGVHWHTLQSPHAQWRWRGRMRRRNGAKVWKKGKEKERGVKRAELEERKKKANVCLMEIFGQFSWDNAFQGG